ncbi:MAG: transporter substrate-binding domain-containing protein [Holophagales bacterium]|nr:transporter substrate-binding domain-containing protein [Holophagales bacterium]
MSLRAFPTLSRTRRRTPAGTLRNLAPHVLTAALLAVPAAVADSTRAVAGETGDTKLAVPRTLEEIQRDGVLVLLTFPHQESSFSRTNLDMGPMAKLAPASHFEGIDVDLMTAFADHLGVELRVRPVSEPRYSALIPELLAGRGDLVASSFSITDERRREVEFSRPYFEVYRVVVTRGDSQVKGVEDLASAVASVTAGSSHEQHLLGLGVPRASIMTVDFSQETYMEVDEGRADYLLADSTSAKLILGRYPDLEIAFRLSGADSYAVAVPPSAELLEPLDRFLEEMERSGELARIVAHYLQPAHLEP